MTCSKIQLLVFVETYRSYLQSVAGDDLKMSKEEVKESYDNLYYRVKYN